MPPRQKQPSKKKPAQASGQKPAETKEDFEKELKLLAGQARDETWARWAKQQTAVYGKAAALIALMAVYANVSLLTLSPVYGQIAATRLHERVVWSALFVGWGANLALRRALPVRTIVVLALVAAYVPMIQSFLFPLSGTFSAWKGPAITEALTLFPLMVLSTACLADVLEGADFSRLPKSIASSAPGLGSYALYRFVELESLRQLGEQIGKSVLQTRVGFQLVLAATYSIMARSKLLAFAIPALLHAAFYNTHLITPISTSSLNSTLILSGWSVVDRWESTTGYISVLNNHQDGFRVLRCDHSLLGGEWTKFPRKIVAEPIYSVFTQLEAVRLVQIPGKATDNEAKALNIGLGIGTTPSALIAHGIDTTIVEIDPVVYEYSKKYFGLPSNHTAVIQDVISWTKSKQADLHEHYDYIIHDVFTGGAEPIALFTDEFLARLEHMLKPNGVIAINYAGDFTMPPLSIVVNTVKGVFPTCRVFREGEAPPEEVVEENGRDFDNVIIFCTKHGEKVTFRDPVEDDYLQSLARKAYLLPQHEVDASAFSSVEDVGILRANETEKLAQWHDRSALGHWAVMRTVLPAQVWENW
ncbi:S-adenosyl-L-methionine-dependent methyltransferase [Xylariaceae sp. FL0662B]|nr:S-adenosyl-L-methionine-dependent methyltransferase [Xylariaceae sp. FL0662B]